MYCVWRAYLKGSIQVSQSRISTCEKNKVQVSDHAKLFRLQKEQQLRKVLFLDCPLLLLFLTLTLLTLAHERLEFPQQRFLRTCRSSHVTRVCKAVVF